MRTWSPIAKGNWTPLGREPSNEDACSPATCRSCSRETK
jgi:hypothetical protein